MSEFGQPLNVEQPLLAIDQPIVAESITKLVEKIVAKKNVEPEFGVCENDIDLELISLDVKNKSNKKQTANSENNYPLQMV